MGFLDKHWCEDGEGKYLQFKDGNIEFDVRPDNTEIYRHPYQYRNIDHLFRELAPGTGQGFFIWRKAVESAFGDVYDEMVLELKAEGFNEIWSNEPDDGDIEVWENYFDEDYHPEQPPERPNQIHSVIDSLVEKETTNLDAAWRWYEEEWRG